MRNRPATHDDRPGRALGRVPTERAVGSEAGPIRAATETRLGRLFVSNLGWYAAWRVKGESADAAREWEQLERNVPHLEARQAAHRQHPAAGRRAASTHGVARW